MKASHGFGTRSGPLPGLRHAPCHAPGSGSAVALGLERRSRRGSGAAVGGAGGATGGFSKWLLTPEC